MYKEILTTLINHKNLNQQQIEEFIQNAVSGKISEVQQAAVLAALNTKGLSVNELTGFVHFLSEQQQELIRLPGAIDVCGTGGSGLQRINTSTIVSFILSALDIPVAKHGNKAASGRFGSFDLLEKLGINIDHDSQHAQKLADQMKLVFLYARSFHPTMKHFSAVRKQLAVPTVFNLLGPLLNPASTRMQIIGTPFADKMQLLAETCKKLGKKHVMIVRGEDGLDEVTLSGKTTVVELKNGRIKKRRISPKDFGVKNCSFDDIKGGTAEENVRIAESILKGTCETRHLDLVLVNAALALCVAGKTNRLRKGYEMAKECVESGLAYQHFMRYKQLSNAPSILLDIVSNKETELSQRKKNISLSQLKKKAVPSRRDFRTALLRSGVSLIAEIKKASPSSGILRKGRFDVKEIATEYELAGARAISVVTDKKYFSGDLSYLKKASEATYNTPLLCKDFIIDEYQIYEARMYGADAILLIAAILSSAQIQHFLEIARTLQMDVLVEVHNEQELKTVLETDADIVGINNRNLHTFKLDKSVVQKLASKIKGMILVAESGITAKADVAKLPKKTEAILVGTSLMKNKNLVKKISSLIGKPKPLLKICGVQSPKEALLCQKLRVDYIGLNFVPESARRISYQMGERIIRALRRTPHAPTKIVGIFKNASLKEINTAAEKLDLDVIQLSGEETILDVKKCVKPVIKGISIHKKSDITRAKKFLPYVQHVLLDSKKPGSGEIFNHKFLKKADFPYLLAGGINESNLKHTLHSFHPLGVDIASGVENDGKRNLSAINRITKIVFS